MLFVGEAAEKTVAGVGRSDFARPLLAVERHRVGRKTWRPEFFPELFPKFFSARGERQRFFRAPQCRGNGGGRLLRSIGITLDLAEGIRRRGERAIGGRD